MDRELTSKEKWQDRRKVIIRWSLGTGAAVAAVVLLAVLIQPSVRESSLRLATVDTGSIEFAVSATGKVVPGYEEIINSPITSRVMEVYKRAGEVVQAGEPLLRLELSEVQTEYDNMLDEERMKELKLEQLRITNRNNLSEMEMNIEIQEMELDRKAAALRNEKYLDSLGAASSRTSGTWPPPMRPWPSWSSRSSARTRSRPAAGSTMPVSGLPTPLPLPSSTAR